MKRDKNLIKYGICNIMVHPILDIDISKTDGTAYNYGKAISLPGTQEINLPSNWASNIIYADNIAYAEQKANLGYINGSLTSVKLTEEFEEVILGDVNGQENADTLPKDFGLSFEFLGDKNHGRVFFYYISLTKRPDIKHTTKGESLSVDGDTVNFNAKPRLDTHDIKVKVYPGDELYDSILNTPPNPVERAAVSAIEISGEDTVEEGKSITLSAETTPEGQAVTWSSLDEDNATVDDGTVTGESEGTATIKCELASDSSVFATKTIIVTPSEL